MREGLRSETISHLIRMHFNSTVQMCGVHENRTQKNGEKMSSHICNQNELKCLLNRTEEM